MAIAVLVAVVAAGFLWLWAVCDRQADQIDDMGAEVERLRQDSDFWPALIRVELLKMEMRLRAWMEERDGAGRKR